MSAQLDPRDSPFRSNWVGLAAITLGAKISTTIIATVQLKDALGNHLWGRGAVTAYLSDDAHGDSIVAAAPSGGWVISANGLLLPFVTNKAAEFISESTGLFDVAVTEAGSKTCYLILILPDGSLVASSAITF